MQQFPAKEMPPFAAGNSQTQVLEVNPGNGQPKTAVTPKNIGQKLVQFMRHRFGPEHLFGSVMTVFYLHRWSKNALSTFPGSLHPEKQGKGFNPLASVQTIFNPEKVKTAVKQTNNPARAMMAGSYLAFFTNLLVAVWQRGGTPPQGEGLGAKTVNAFRHPNLSTMFTNCVMMGAALLTISAGKVAGGTAQLRKIKNGSMLEAMKQEVGGNDALASDMLNLTKRAETMRVASGLFYLIAAPITYISMFHMGDKKNKEQPSAPKPTTEQQIQEMKTMAAFKASQTRVLSFSNLKKAMQPYKLENVKGALGHAFKNDKVGIIARSCMVAAECLQMGEGWARSKKKTEILQKAGVDDDVIKGVVKNARETMISGTWGALLTIGHTIYAYGRVLAESRQQESNGKEMVR